jgi:hypothetical protein
VSAARKPADVGPDVEVEITVKRRGAQGETFATAKITSDELDDCIDRGQLLDMVVRTLRVKADVIYKAGRPRGGRRAQP